MLTSVEILCVGTELLLGQIVNTNARFLAAEVAALGIPHHYQTVVGDNPERICRALDVALARSGLLLITGGLGPTADDLTHPTLATYFGVPLVRRPELVAAIEARLHERHRPLNPTDLRQAELPAGAAVLPNPAGSAAGILWQPRPQLTILTFPGVPAEMRAMWAGTGRSYLRSLGWGEQVFLSRTLRHWGVGESALAERAAAYLAGSNPTVAPYAGEGEVQLRVTARAADPQAALALIEPVARQLQALAGLDYFGSDEESLALVVGRLLTAAGTTLAVAESCTGGLLGEAITRVPGASAFFVGGVVAYADRLKEDLLGVEPATIRQFGAVSEPVVRQMASGVRRYLGSDWGLAISGICGPGGGSAAKPVGLVHLALAGSDGVQSRVLYLGAERGRESIRQISAQSALDLLRRYMLTAERSDIMGSQ